MTRARDIADSGVATTLEGVELNLLDGATVTTAELNILDGVTATAVELNYVDGVTSAVQTQLNTATTAINTKSPTASPTFTGTVTAPTVNASTAFQIGGVAITSTPAELNILDGVTSTAAELNILDGVTSTAVELNLLDGVTATTAELNYLDGVTSDLQTQITAAAASGGGGGAAAYKVTNTFTAPVYFKKVDIIPNGKTVVGTWELFENAEIWVSELTTITTNEEYLVTTESKSNHIFYGTAYVGVDAVVTVTDTMEGLGDSEAYFEWMGR